MPDPSGGARAPRQNRRTYSRPGGGGKHQNQTTPLDSFVAVRHQRENKGENAMGIFLRWLGAFILLSVTYNPTDWNYIAWVRDNWANQMPLAVFLGMLLGVAYMVYGVATLRSIGPFGIIVIAAIFGSGLWVLIDWGILTLANPSLNLWLGILVGSLILGIGLSWSILRQRLSGQASVDEIEG